ncbi:MAG: hypothetical protein R3F61_12440 [Myxococcota bacterium]
MNRFAVYLVPGFLLARAGDPALLPSLLDAEAVAPVLAWTSPHDVLEFLLSGWTWTDQGGPPNERVFVMGVDDLHEVDVEDLDERAHGIALQHAVDSHELEKALEADTITEHADDVLGALVIAVHTLRNAVVTASENGAALVIVITRKP